MAVIGSSAFPVCRGRFDGRTGINQGRDTGWRSELPRQNGAVLGNFHQSLAFTFIPMSRQYCTSAPVASRKNSSVFHSWQLGCLL